MNSLIKNIIRSTSGSSMLELALVLPVFLLMIVIALDFGSAFSRKMDIANAAKAGIQYALVKKPVEGDLTDITNAVSNNLGDSGNDTTTVSAEYYLICAGVKKDWNETCPVGTYYPAYVSVTITEDYITPFFSYDWIVNDFTISEKTTIQLK